MTDDQPAPLEIDVRFNETAAREAVRDALRLVAAKAGGLTTFTSECGASVALILGEADIRALPPEQLSALATRTAHLLYGLCLVADGAMTAAENLGLPRQDLMRHIETGVESFEAWREMRASPDEA